METARQKIFLLYRNSIIISFIILIITYIWRNGVTVSFNPYYLNKAFAWTGFFLIGISMGLTSFCYFVKRWQRLIIYRKYIGVIGFWYFLIHAGTSLFILSNVFPFPKYYFDGRMIYSTTASFVAGLILTSMIIASRQFMIRYLGIVVWRRILRLGFLVMFLVIIHFSLKFAGLPAIALFALIFSVIIFMLRIILEFKIRNKTKIQPQTNDQNIKSVGTGV